MIDTAGNKLEPADPAQLLDYAIRATVGNASLHQEIL